MSWGVKGRKQLLRLPELLPGDQGKSGLPHICPCALKEILGWERDVNFWDLGRNGPRLASDCREESRWKKGLIRPFKQSKLVLVLCPLTPLRYLSQSQWFWVKRTKTYLAVVLHHLLEILLFCLPVGNALKLEETSTQAGSSPRHTGHCCWEHLWSAVQPLMSLHQPAEPSA